MKITECAFPEFGARKGSRRSLYLGVFVILFACCAESFCQSGSGTRLHQIEQLSGSSKKSASYEALAKLLFEKAYSSDLVALSGLEKEIVSAQREFNANPKKHGSSDLDVTAAFDEWRGAVRDPNAEPTSASALYSFRASLSHFAPSLITKDENGIVSDRVSPVEAVYLFDLLIANGGVPKVTHASTSRQVPIQPDADTKQNLLAYASASQSYVVNTPITQRQSKLIDIVHSHLLK